MRVDKLIMLSSLECFRVLRKTFHNNKTISVSNALTQGAKVSPSTVVIAVVFVVTLPI